MTVLKVILLQAFWYLAVAFGHKYQIPILLSAVTLCVANYFIYKPSVTKGHYFFTLSFFILYGLFQEALFEGLGLVSYGQESFPFWLTALYFVFIGYYGDLFNYLSKKPVSLLFVIGSLGGISSYFGGAKISPIEVLSPYYYLAVGIGWGIFFPLSIKIFYEGFMWNKILDASLYYSFDKSGFLRHQKYFNDDYQFKPGAKAIITGGTSGIGQAASLEMINQGVEVLITGRSKEKGEAAAKAHENLNFISWDMANWKEIPAIVEGLAPLDYVVLNAGGMPTEFQKNNQDIELQFASQLFGHYYLIKELKEKGKLKKGARIVWVTSGGMYLAKLDLKTIFENPKYDKVATYANVKRAQVTLLPYFKEEFTDQIITAMHPGWAETPGVSSAIPEFDKKMKGKLRSPLQGADTILWLLGTKKNLSSGSLYFDRRLVTKHFFWFTKSSDKKLNELVDILKSKIF
jgi:dehydrogenase/reductase SDR family protein 12